MGENKSDAELGMNARITRRDFLNATMLGAGAALLHARSPLELGSQAAVQADEWTGFAGVGDYARSNGNTWEVVQASHRIRDGAYAGDAIPGVRDTGELFDLVVVGGGFSGLGAAYFARKHGLERTLVLDNHAMWGGEGKRNEFLVDGVRLIGPQGSNAFGLAGRGDEWHKTLWTEVGIPATFEHQAWAPGIKPLPMPRDNHWPQLWTDEFPSNGFFFKAPDGSMRLVRDVFRNLASAPWPEPLRKDFVRWRTDMKRYYAGDDWQQWLDTMTYERYLVKIMGLDPAVARWADPSMAGGIGLGSDVLSAYAAAQIRMPGFQGFGAGVADRSLEYGHRIIASFPGGNDGILRHLVKWLNPDAIAGGTSFAEVQLGRVRFDALDRTGLPTRIRLGATVVRVENLAAGDAKVAVTYAVAGKLYRVGARRVVMANGGWSSQHIVRGLPAAHRDAYQWFPRAPMMVVNVALRHWRFMYDPGITAINYRDQFGFACNLRQTMVLGDYQPVLHPDRPILLTFTISFSQAGLSLKEQVAGARTTMLGTTYRDYERQLREQLVRLLGQFGLDPKRDIAGIVLNRWGHAYCCPAPGFYFGRDGKPAARDVIREPFGRIAFANAELNGHQNHYDATKEGKRALEQLI